MSGTGSTPPRKPVRGSRPASSAPRRLAGQGAGRVPRDDAEVPEEPTTDLSTPDEPTTDEPTSGEPTASASEDVTTVPPTEVDRPGAPTGQPASARTTAVLAALLALLVVTAVVLAGFVRADDDARWFGLGGQDESETKVWRYQAGERFVMPERPVSVNYVEWRNASDAATNAVLDILTVDWKTYDKHLDAVLKRMTDDFAKEYKATAEDSRAKFLETKADYEFEVVGQSVVSASEDEVTSLLFLNQYVYKGEGDARVGPDVYQVRVVVTAVPSGDEWIVDQLDAL